MSRESLSDDAKRAIVSDAIYPFSFCTDQSWDQVLPTFYTDPQAPIDKHTLPAFLAFTQNQAVFRATLERADLGIKADIQEDLKLGTESKIIARLNKIAENSGLNNVELYEPALSHYNNPKSQQLPQINKRSACLVGIENFLFKSERPKTRMSLGAFSLLAGAGSIGLSLSSWLALAVLGTSLNPVTAGILLAGGIFLATVGALMLTTGAYKARNPHLSTIQYRYLPEQDL